MSTPAKTLSLQEQFDAVPETEIAEIINGTLYTQPRPARPHANVASVLLGELHGPFRRGIGGPGGWYLYFEPELHLGGHKLVPDIAGWRVEHLADVAPNAAAFRVPPDWICEVLSTGTEAIDRHKKMPIYAEHRVQHLWLIDPLEDTLEAYRLEPALRPAPGQVMDGPWLQLGVWMYDARVRVEPFDAFELDLFLLWRP